MNESARDPSPLDRPALLGGKPACDFQWSRWPISDETEARGLMEVLHSGNWWFGDQVKEFEAKFAEFQGADHAVTCTNGTTALEMALRAIGVVPGDEVIVPAYTFIATASAVVTVGAVPVFADIDPATLCIDPTDVERKLTSRTRAIVPVHVSGVCADMKRLNAIGSARGVTIMEDAAHAWGSRVSGSGAGTLSSCGTFSFQVTKNLTAGEGGILVSNDAGIAELCRSYTHCGRTPGSAWYDHDVLGSNLRMTEFQAAIMLAQLTRAESQLQRRAVVAQRIDEALTGLAGVTRLAPTPEMDRRSYHMYIFRVDESVLGVSRDRVIEALVAEGVPASAGWYRPIYRNKVFQNAHIGPPHGIRAPLAGLGVDYREVACPVCEQVCQDAIWVPQHVLLADDAQTESLTLALVKVLNSAAELASAPS